MKGPIPGAIALIASLAAAASAQTPAPFPRPVDPQRPAPSSPPTAKPAPPPGAPAPTARATDEERAPTEQMLGVPVYRGAQFIASYDAGRNQRYYLFGTNTTVAEIVAF